MSAAVADPLRSSPRDSPAVSLSGKASPIRHPRDCPGGAQGRRPRTTPGRLPPGHGGLLSPSPFSLSSLLRVGRPQRNAVSAVTRSGVGVPAPPADTAWWRCASAAICPPTVARVLVPALATQAPCSRRVSRRPCDTCFHSLTSLTLPSCRWSRRYWWSGPAPGS